MSNAFAIAGVTSALQTMLWKRLKDPEIADLVPAEIGVIAFPPDRAAEEAKTNPRLNLFLFDISPNPGWSNMLLPSRDSSGQDVGNPPLALDLRYLISACGRLTLDAEILLGLAMQALHEVPGLSRAMIRQLLDPSLPDDTVRAPQKLREQAVKMADQVEAIKITPQHLSSEEMSKLWTAFQTHYRPSAAYLVTVVLIEGRRATKPLVPVRERNVYAAPFQQPSISTVEAASGRNDPLVAGSTLLIRGERLRSTVTKVLLDAIPFPPAEKDISASQISLPVPTTLRAGLHTAQVAHELKIGTPPQPHRGIESNVAAFLLHPKITVPATGQKDLTIPFSPKVGKTQRVRLLLGEHPPPPDRAGRAYSLSAPANNGITALDQDTATVTFPLTGVAQGSYLVRAQVDGAESALVVDSDEASPTFNQFIGPKVVITP
jgi:hypothetical protein